jgi:hypothetical protein
MQEQQAEIGQGETGQAVASEVVHMSGSLALSAQAGKEMQVSGSAVGALVAGEDMQVTNSLGNMLVAGRDIAMADSVGGVLVAGNSGTVNQGVVGVIISQQTVLGEGSRVLLDTPQAIAFGAALGAMLGLVSWLLRRRKAKRK